MRDKVRSVTLIQKPHNHKGYRAMRVEGLEPSRGHPRWILNPVRLPFRHTRL